MLNIISVIVFISTSSYVCYHLIIHKILCEELEDKIILNMIILLSLNICFAPFSPSYPIQMTIIACMTKILGVITIAIYEYPKPKYRLLKTPVLLWGNPLNIELMAN